MNLAMTRKIDEKRNRERRIIWMSSLTNWLEERNIKHREEELLQKMHRELWQDTIVHVLPSEHDI